MVHVEDVLLWSLAQAGDRYVFGAEVAASASDADRWDCSELVEWSCARAGVVPRVPDGAYYQWRHTRLHGLAIPVAQGVATRGALLFVGDGTGVGRDAITHVAWSLGDGTTIEARGSKWGVGSWPTASRFDWAGLVPGVDYSPGHGQLPPGGFMLDDATETQMRTLLRSVLDEGTAMGLEGWANTNREDIALGRANFNALAAIAKAIGALDGVDEAALAAEIVLQVKQVLVGLPDEQLEQLPGLVADELDRRQRERLAHR